MGGKAGMGCSGNNTYNENEAFADRGGVILGFAV
jgi:hypothetical protein